MTGTPVPIAEWSAGFIAWMHPSAVLLAFMLPLLTALVRRVNGHVPCFNTTNAFHDAAAGFALPSFVALALSGMSPEVAKHVDGHAAVLAGALGIIYTIAGLFKVHTPTLSGSENSRH